MMSMTEPLCWHRSPPAQHPPAVAWPLVTLPLHYRRAFSTHTKSRTTIRATARKVQQTAAEEWASLASGGDDVADEDDPELMQAINEVCNHGLRLMLRGETNRLLEYQDELSRYGQHFTERGNMKGATFIYVLYKMSEHILPKEMVKLEGVYLDAFSRMFGLLEDSGWQLVKEPEPGEQLELEEEPTEEQLRMSGYTS